MPNDFNQHVIDEFRANRGRVGGPFSGGRLILLTTTGARTGAPHTTPVAYLPDGSERILVLGSAGGAPHHPQWYRNLIADPRVTVEDGVSTYPAVATVLTGAERDEAFARAAGHDPGWAAYQDKTSRTIPVVALRATDAGLPPTNAKTLGGALRDVHDAFRRELATIRREVATAGPTLGAQLRVNCLTACQGLHNHHAGEDLMLFPGLLARHPSLASTLDELRADHERVAVLVTELRAAVTDGDPATVGSTVDRLVGELQDHLTREEDQLIPLLDELPATDNG
jgi:deazaflavin-dependent oxidoreductase (nitroreductase family)